MEKLYTKKEILQTILDWSTEVCEDHDYREWVTPSLVARIHTMLKNEEIVQRERLNEETTMLDDKMYCNFCGRKHKDCKCDKVINSL